MPTPFSHIGVFLDELKKPLASHFVAHISLLLKLGASVAITSNVEELEIWLRERKMEILLLFHEDRFGSELEYCLQRSRNFSQARPMKLCSLAHSLSSEDVNRLGRLGVLSIYVDPVRPESWLNSIRDLLSPVPRIPSLLHLTPIRPILVDASCFGRIGKFHLAPPGALSVETSLKVRAGDLVQMRGEFESATPGAVSRYAVKEVLKDNLYYRYENRIELEPIFKMKEKNWLEWIQKQKDSWVAPKTKLLWITSQYPLLERTFSTRACLVSMWKVHITSIAKQWIGFRLG